MQVSFIEKGAITAKRCRNVTGSTLHNDRNIKDFLCCGLNAVFLLVN